GSVAVTLSTAPLSSRLSACLALSSGSGQVRPERSSSRFAACVMARILANYRRRCDKLARQGCAAGVGGIYGMITGHRDKDRHNQRSAMKPLRIWLAVAALCAPVASQAQVNLPALGDSLSSTISTQQEYDMGREFMRSIRR